MRAVLHTVSHASHQPLHTTTPTTSLRSITFSSKNSYEPFGSFANFFFAPTGYTTTTFTQCTLYHLVHLIHLIHRRTGGCAPQVQPKWCGGVKVVRRVEQGHVKR